MIPMLHHNLGMKLLALILAVVAWGTLRIVYPIEVWEEITFVVDVVPGENRALVSQFPLDTHIKTRIIGPLSQLERIDTLRLQNPQDPPLKAVLDCRGIESGKPGLVRPRLNRRYPNVKIIFEPASFQVIVEEKARKEIRTEEVTEGQLPPGYFIEESVGVLSTVRVEGAVSLVGDVDRVIYNLDLSSMTGSTALTIDYIPVDIDGEPVENLLVVPESSNLRISVRSSQALKTVPVVPDYQGTPATNYALTSLSPDPFLVEVSGPGELLMDIASVRTATIELTGRTSSFTEIVDLIRPTDGVSLSVTRVNISVQIRQIDSTFTFENLLIEERNKNSAYRYELSVDRVDVAIRGGPARISQVTSDLIRPQVDYTGLAPGLHTIPVSVALPSGVRKDSVSPSRISVTVTETAPPQDEPDETPVEEPVENPVEEPSEDSEPAPSDTD